MQQMHRLIMFAVFKIPQPFNRSVDYKESSFG